jgi:hypothetical protein
VKTRAIFPPRQFWSKFCPFSSIRSAPITKNHSARTHFREIAEFSHGLDPKLPVESGYLRSSLITKPQGSSATAGHAASPIVEVAILKCLLADVLRLIAQLRPPRAMSTP